MVTDCETPLTFSESCAIIKTIKGVIQMKETLKAQLQNDIRVHEGVGIMKCTLGIDVDNKNVIRPLAEYELSRMDDELILYLLALYYKLRGV